MNIHLVSITNNGAASSRRPGFSLCADWLPDMGFIPGALVQALPEPNGMIFNLCNENISSYSDLFNSTQDKGGKLIQSCQANIKDRITPVLAVSGQLIYDAGFTFGDALIVHYEHGVIRARKLPDTVRVVHMTNAKEQRTGSLIPMLKPCGEWLNAFGFFPDALVTAAAEPGCVTFTLQDGCIEKYADLVRFARRNKLKLLQVRENPGRGRKGYPYIMVMGAFLETTGFMPGEALLAFCEKGSIKLQKLDLADLGF